MDICGLNKAVVLAALYNNAKPQGNAGIFFSEAKPMSVEEAQSLLDGGQTYFDYVKGRVMKVALEGDELDTRLYNRDNGPGAAEKAILEASARPKV